MKEEADREKKRERGTTGEAERKLIWKARKGNILKELERKQGGWIQDCKVKEKESKYTEGESKDQKQGKNINKRERKQGEQITKEMRRQRKKLEEKEAGLMNNKGKERSKRTQEKID